MKIKWPHSGRPDSPPQQAGFTKRVLLGTFVIAIALFLWAVRDALMLVFAAVLLAIAVHGIADMLSPKGKLPRRAALALKSVSIGTKALPATSSLSSISSILEPLFISKLLSPRRVAHQSN